MTDFDPTLIATLQSAQRITVLTGAGISAESGIPTFRDAQTGLWSKFRPEELASPEAFAHNPQRVWDWYADRRRVAAQAQPNPGHIALAELERRVAKLTIITQNVDGLHQRAGSGRVLELHGSLQRVRCSREGTAQATWPEGGDVPACPECGALLRPDIVWFGEALPVKTLEHARVAFRARAMWPSQSAPRRWSSRRPRCRCLQSRMALN